MSHVVTAALVISKKEDGSDLYLYEGAELPDHVSEAEVKRLSALGMVAETEEASSDEDSSADDAGGTPPRGRKKPIAESN